jgi:hypothetical protein
MLADTSATIEKNFPGELPYDGQGVSLEAFLQICLLQLGDYGHTASHVRGHVRCHPPTTSTRKGCQGDTEGEGQRGCGLRIYRSPKLIGLARRRALPPQPCGQGAALVTLHQLLREARLPNTSDHRQKVQSEEVSTHQPHA